MSRRAALAASLEADYVNAPEEVVDVLAVLGTVVSRMLEKDMRRHEILSALFPEEEGSSNACTQIGRVCITILLKMGIEPAFLDGYLEKLLRHAI